MRAARTRYVQLLLLTAVASGLGGCASSEQADARGTNGPASAGPEGPDAGTGSLGEGGGAGPSCGAERCRADQSCTDGKCAFACSGVRVPGDYPTLTSAFAALSAVDADATICLGEQTYTEEVPLIEMLGPGQHRSLQLIGVSATRTQMVPSLVFRGGWGVANVRGISFVGTAGFAMSFNDGGTLKVEGSRFSHNGLFGIDASNAGGAFERASNTTLVVDGCLFETSNYAISMTSAGVLGTGRIRITNNVFRGNFTGVSVFSDQFPTELTLENNTMVDVGRGLALHGAGTTATYANNIFTGMRTVGITIDDGTGAAQHANNALFGNVADYAGIAQPGIGDVTADCLLDVTPPVPTLASRSPCRGAGTAASAPPTDFYGVPRASSVDLGALQSLDAIAPPAH